MKNLALLPLMFFLSACLLSAAPKNANYSRPTAKAGISDMDTLEMLLLNEQQSIYENHESLASTDSLRLGMGKNRVASTLGHPQQVEVAGNPKYGNERWTYEINVPTLDGYYKERKIIYFEGGSVVGWESH